MQQATRFKIAISVVCVSTLLHGVAVGSVDLLAQSVNQAKILRYDGLTGAVEAPFAVDPTLDRGGKMIIGPGGDLYVSSHGLDAILRFDGTTGQSLGVFAGGEPGSGPNIQPGQTLDGPNALAFGPDGYLYVVSNHNNRVVRYDGVTGAFVDVFQQFPGSAGLVGLTFDHAGDLYVTRNDTDAVVKWNPTSQTFVDFVPGGSGGLNLPLNIAFGSDNALYVAAQNTNAVLRYDGVTGAPLPAPGKTGAVFAEGGGLDIPMDIAFGPDGNLYVAAWSTDGILRYDGATGQFIDVFAPGDGLPGSNSLLFIPEPASLMLLVLGGLALGRRRSG